MAVCLETWEAHTRHLEAVLVTIQSIGLTFHTDKCKFAQPSVKYLGHVVGSGKHSPDPERVSAIAGLKVLLTKMKLRSALGLLITTEAVPAYSEVVCPLTDLTKQRVPSILPWSAEGDQALGRARAILSDLPTLSAPHLLPAVQIEHEDNRKNKNTKKLG